MDIFKFNIPLWLFLVISALSISKCKSNCLSKYNMVPNIADVTTQNCFCFKKPGDHRSVTDILNKNDKDLERLILYLYRYKSTGQVKLYIPNFEKQNLVPNLAFEVGDILKILEDDSKVKDFLNLYVRTRTPHTCTEHPKENEVILVDTKLPDTTQNVISHDVTNSSKTNENYNDGVNSHGSSVINLQPTEVINIPAQAIDVDYYGTPSIGVDVQDEGVNVDEKVNPTTESINVNGSYDHVYFLPENNVDVIKTPSKKVEIIDESIHFNDDDDKESNGVYNILPTEVVFVPAKSFTGFEEYEKHVLPEDQVDINKTPSKEVDIQDEGVEIYDGNYNELNDINLKPAEVVNVSSENIYINSFEDHEQHHLPENNLDINKTPSTDENISDADISTGNVNYHDTSVVNEMLFPIKNISDKGTLIYNNNQGRPNNLPSIFINKVPKESEKHENKWNEYIQSNEEVRFVDTPTTSAEKQGSKDKQATPSFENHNEYETFDIWFVQQMQRFKTYTEHDRAIDLATIERYIIKILKDNDMHVTNEGVLTDSFGTALDVQNLRLRPILIGNSLAFGSILNENIKDLVMPANLSYLQAILVTNTKPSMLLGIIPIGKTLIPPSTINAFSTFLKPSYNTKTYIKTTVKPIHHNKTSAQANNKRFVYGRKPIVLHLTGKLPTPKKIENIITLVKQTPVKKLQHHQSHQSVDTPLVYQERYSGEDEIALSNESLETVNKLIESLRDGNNPIMSIEATNKLLASLRNNKEFVTSKLAYGERKPVDVDVVDDDISERIVGGSAATSSGRPLSVKGRIKD